MLSCVFAGTSASVALKSSVRVTDDVWRTVRCERNATDAIMYINGVREVRRAVATGSIANNWTLAIGGKSSCNSVSVSCDYFRGDLDYLRIDRPGSTTPTTTTTTRPPTTTSTTTTTRPPTTTSTTTTTRPPTTTTTTTVVTPATQLPTGRVDSVSVSGSTIVVTGRSSDANARPIVQVVDVVNGRRTVINQRANTATGFTVSYAAASGTHRVCVNLLDVDAQGNPTGQVVPLSCQDAVVK